MTNAEEAVVKQAEEEAAAVKKEAAEARARAAAVKKADTGEWALREEAEWVFGLADKDKNGTLDAEEVWQGSSLIGVGW